MAREYAFTRGAVHVYLDGIEHDGSEALMCAAHGVDEHGWNGFAVPLVTAAEFARFVSAAARNDRNSTYAPESIVEGDGALIYEDECGRDMWTVVDIVDGSPVYAIDGWTWNIFHRDAFDIERWELEMSR